jgi:hypothetical protein
MTLFPIYIMTNNFTYFLKEGNTYSFVVQLMLNEAEM